jgi:hypothetical protein
MEFYRRLNWFQWFLTGAFILILSGAAGLVMGYITGTRARAINAALSDIVDYQTQFELGLQDYRAGNYNLARQRFEYVLKQDPDFPGAAHYLAETLLRLNESGVQVTDIIAPTATLSPTPDTRAVDELYTIAKAQFQNQEWRNLVQTILALRNNDPHYQVVEVDKMLFLGLRFGGIEKILNEGDLEGGLYDLALAEQFAPLDAQAGIYQEWARLYQIGVSFWGVLPEWSVYYFRQLAAAAPYLRDFSGIPAIDRFRLALVQYGDQLAEAKDWCAAFEQYNLAASMGGVAGLQPTLTYVDEKCQHSIATPTWTPSPTSELTATPTLSVTITIIPTLSLTSTPTNSMSFTSTPTTTASPTIQSSPTATPSITPTPSLLDTHTPTATATATPTQTPTGESTSQE